MKWQRAKKQSEREPVPLKDHEVRAVAGGVSIYVDGVYWGEGTFDYWPWPGGRSMTGAPVVFR